MSRIRVAIRIAAQPSEVWADLAEISRHVEWMRDAVALTFTSASSRGVGTTFDCLTQIGPIRLTDRMEITAWDEGRSIGVRHVGIVTGEGTIRLRRSGRQTYRHSLTDHQKTFLERQLNRRIPSSYIRFLWFMSTIARRTASGPSATPSWSRSYQTATPSSSPRRVRRSNDSRNRPASYWKTPCPKGFRPIIH